MWDWSRANCSARHLYHHATFPVVGASPRRVGDLQDHHLPVGCPCLLRPPRLGEERKRASRKPDQHTNVG
eukprot:655224-Prorocentrum_minimum.AAC.1